jgi:hypothetical protein
MVGRLLSTEAAAKVRASFEPIGGFAALGRDKNTIDQFCG